MQEKTFYSSNAKIIPGEFMALPIWAYLAILVPAILVGIVVAYIIDYKKSRDRLTMLMIFGFLCLFVQAALVFMPIKKTTSSTNAVIATKVLLSVIGYALILVFITLKVKHEKKGRKKKRK